MPVNEIVGPSIESAEEAAAETVHPSTETNEPVSGSRWIRAAVLTLIGLLAAWSWLFVVSKWGPANRIDILTFKAGLTSKVMRTLLRDGQGTGHHSHTSAMISGIYATPTYFTMTEQSRLAAKYQPDRFAVFYVFEDIHAGELPRTPPMMMLRTDNGQQLLPVDRELLTDSFHHRATIVRFPLTTADGALLVSGSSSALNLVVHDPTAHLEQTMEWKLPIVYPKDLQEADVLSLSTLFALLQVCWRCCRHACCSSPSITRSRWQASACRSALPIPPRPGRVSSTRRSGSWRDSPSSSRPAGRLRDWPDR